MTTEKYLVPIMIARNISNLLFFIVLFFIFQSHAISQNKNCCNWKLTKEQNNIKIYIRKNKNSNLKEALGVAEIKTSLSAIISLLKDTENHKSWMYANKKSKILKSPNHFNWVLHTESEAPWPILNRDLISQAKMSQSLDNCTIKISAYAIPNYINKKEGLVRITEMDSEWTFTPKKNGFIEVRFKIRVNLGGSLPIWLTNLAVDKGPYSTLSKMKKELTNKKYKLAKLSYIKENCNLVNP